MNLFLNYVGLLNSTYVRVRISLLFKNKSQIFSQQQHQLMQTKIKQQQQLPQLKHQPQLFPSATPTPITIKHSRSLQPRQLATSPHVTLTVNTLNSSYIQMQHQDSLPQLLQQEQQQMVGTDRFHHKGHLECMQGAHLLSSIRESLILLVLHSRPKKTMGSNF